MSKNDIVINKYNINHRSARRLFRVNSYNDFVKPDEPSQTCLSLAMARTFVQVRAEGKLAMADRIKELFEVKVYAVFIMRSTSAPKNWLRSA